MGDFRENCEFSLIREELNVLFRQYRSGKLTSSTAYTESGRLLDYDGRCGEALFLRYYALRVLLEPGKNPDFFKNDRRPEARLLRQIVEDSLSECDDLAGGEDEGLHYYLLDRGQVLELMSREFHSYLRDFYFSRLETESKLPLILGGEIRWPFKELTDKIKVFESIYPGGDYPSLYVEMGRIQDKLDKLAPLFPTREEYNLFVQTRCLQYLKPYLESLREHHGALTEQMSQRFIFAFRKINELMEVKAQSLAGHNNLARSIEFSVIEGELDRAIEENHLPRQIHHR